MMLEKMQKGFFKFINIALLIIFIPIFIGAVHKVKGITNTFGMNDIALLSICAIIIAITIFMQKKKVKSLYIVLFLVVAGFILRFIYIFSVNSVPISDYNTMMQAASSALNGEYSGFKELGYFSRFPHLITPTLYFSTVMKITTDYLWVIKVINVILSTISIVTMYFIGKEVFNSKRKGQWAGLIMAIYPPVIVYTATYAPENLAMPFYLLSIYFLIRVVKGKIKPPFIILAGIFLSFGNMFRAVATVMLVAFIMYIWICNEKTVRKKTVQTAILIISYIIPFVIWSNVLLHQNITDHQLWDSAEPAITNILKGTNIQSGGTWNLEDAQLVEQHLSDKDKLTEACKDKIVERLTETPTGTLVSFYYNKLVNQWKDGDFSAVYWAEHSVVDDGNQLFLSKGGMVFIQIFFIALLVLGYIGLFNRKQNLVEKNINLFYIILGGYGMFYLISELQARYAFIVCWVFIIFAVNGLEVLTVKYLKD